MFNIEVSEFVAYIKNTECKKEYWKKTYFQEDHTIRKTGILVELDLELINYETGKHRRSTVHFVLCGNTNVFVAISRDKNINFSTFKNTSNHDSCWADDGIRRVLNELYFKWADEIREDKAPVELSNICWNLLWHSHKRVWVTYKRVNDDNYRNQLINVQVIPQSDHIAPPNTFRILVKRGENDSFFVDTNNKHQVEDLLRVLCKKLSTNDIVSVFDDEGKKVDFQID